MLLSGILGGFETLKKHFFEIFGVKEQKEKTGKKMKISGKMLEKIRKNRKIKISVEIFYRSPLKTKILPIFRSKFSTFCSLRVISYRE